MIEAHQYSIRASNPEAHLFEVRVTVAAPDPAGQVFALPAWIPGSYMIRDFARNVVDARAEANGRAVALRKLDKSRWQAASVDGSLTLVAQVFALDDSVRGAHLDDTHAYFNGACLLPAVVGQESAECLLDILPPDNPVPEDWRVVTSMQRQDAGRYAFGRYRASDYADLIDHPVEAGPLAIGEFEAHGIPHTVAIRGRTRVDMPRLCNDLQTLCAYQLQFLGPPADLDRYLFLLHAPGSGYGGLEHRCSSSLVCERDNLPQPGDKSVSDGYRTLLGLASHEYFHLWNIKRLKPAVFSPYDLTTESYTRLLWVFEGITSYYDDLALLRSGLIATTSYLELVGQTITRVNRGAGRTRQSVADSSFDAWIKFYKQDANATNAVVSYYAKGALIALALDLTLRHETDGRVSLDDVMRACWQRWGADPGSGGMPEDGFEALCAELAGISLDEFFAAAVHGTDELPLPSLLAKFGVTYQLRPASSATDKGGKPANGDKPAPLWLGATLQEAQGKLQCTAVINSGPAEAAGIAPGDVIVALDGLALTAGNLERRLRDYRAAESLDLVIFRGDVLLTKRITLKLAPATTCYLGLDDSADAAALARRAAWLQSK